MKILSFMLKRWWVLLLLVVAMGWVGSGCSSEDAENTSARPWNSPEGWQNGSAGLISQPH